MGAASARGDAVTLACFLGTGLYCALCLVGAWFIAREVRRKPGVPRCRVVKR